ncbi:MAG: methionine adenosyltransferase, partial [Acidimicrobiia bacterium]|nr:methionine adenosyltransferase [Acidimicrobiia bacterium]
MSHRRWFFSSESVTEGHPDKVCDAISDGVLDAALSGDELSRVACETLVTSRTAIVAGEITSAHALDIDGIARSVISEIGYVDFDPEFDANTLEVRNLVHEQSADIAMGVDQDGAGDQGIMFGYACTETEELMPVPIQLAHRLAERLATVRKDGTLPYLRPDGKTQVTVRYSGDQPEAVTSILISTHHAPGVDIDTTMRQDLEQEVIKSVIPGEMYDPSATFYLNPTGRFEIGGPHADTGLTGRKIIVDTYGGYARHGGGAFSGKDPTKVDRSAAYAARHAAKNVVAAGLASRCEVQLAYAIGRAEPFSILVDTFGTANVDPDRLERTVSEVFDFRPRSII